MGAATIQPLCPATLPIADLPSTWYFAARSRELGPGAVIPVDFGERSLVLFRGIDSKSVSALSAQCSHLGAHLRHGTVVGDRIRCALHHREFDGSGVCQALPGGTATAGMPCQKSYPVVEKYGAAFVCPDPSPPFDFPFLEGTGGREWVTRVSRPHFLPVSWRAIITNAFDVDHLQFVHKRALLERPVFSRPDAHRAVLEYRSRTTGSGLSDRVMRALSGQEIRVKMTCHGGPLMIVESEVGGFQAFMVFSIHPKPSGSEVHSVMGLRRRAPLIVDKLAVRIAQWLYISFLKRDVGVLEDFDLHRPAIPQTVGDQILCQFADYLDGLPGLSEDTHRRMEAVGE